MKVVLSKVEINPTVGQNRLLTNCRNDGELTVVTNMAANFDYIFSRY